MKTAIERIEELEKKVLELEQELARMRPLQPIQPRIYGSVPTMPWPSTPIEPWPAPPWTVTCTGNGGNK